MTGLHILVESAQAWHKGPAEFFAHLPSRLEFLTHVRPVVVNQALPGDHVEEVTGRHIVIAVRIAVFEPFHYVPDIRRQVAHLLRLKERTANVHTTRAAPFAFPLPDRRDVIIFELSGFSCHIETSDPANIHPV
jgi:hypothetical protein